MKRMLIALGALGLLGSMALAQTTVRVRGTITALQGDTLTLTLKNGDTATIALKPDAKVTAVVPAALADVKPGSFIGTAARTQADGTLKAMEVHVFPEAMRGAGEGHHGFDLGPQSTMTNGTVGQEVVGHDGNTLTIRYKGGEKAVTVPPDVPVVSFEPGERALLTAGAHVIVFASEDGDKVPTSAQVVVGRNGLVPPM